jgi:ABC-2 type transport system ATP-binding protein
VIELDDLTKRFGTVLAVDGLTFTVPPGRVTGFLGLNGAGKSTTLRMILGLDHPSTGSARINGQLYRQLVRPLTTVGAMLDAQWINKARSARAHLRWIARSNQLPSHRVDTVLEEVGLADVARRRAGTFSQGMLQRLGIAAALLGDPEVLILDEPLNGLDPEGIAWMRRSLRQLAAQGRTVFVSSHVLSEVELVADELVVIHKGRLVSQCTPEQFIQAAGGPAIRVRSSQLDRLHSVLLEQDISVEVDYDALLVTGVRRDTVGELAAAHQIPIYELSPVAAPLENAFLSLTRSTTTPE